MPKSRAPTTSQQIAGLWAEAEGKPPPRKHNNKAAQSNAATKKKRTVRKHFDPQKTNAAFEMCYADLVPSDEWQDFLSALRRPLPTTFSFVATGCAAVAPSLVQRRWDSLVAALGERAAATHDHAQLQAEEEEDGTAAAAAAAAAPVEVVPAGCRVILRLQVRNKGERVSSFLRTEAAPIARSARQLAWFPHGRGWQLDTPRKELSALRVCCRELRQYLEEHTMLGRVNRQEAVSMLPPLLLRVGRGHSVLDLCAAPGSKTVLLLSQLVQGGRGDGGGCVIANDINPMRGSKLRVRVGRSRVPGSMVTCHPAQLYPGARETFDRVLTDVPCSGDGTLRKNPDIWGSWQPMFSASLHPLQVQILSRGLELLKVGGYLVYSTCSFSPVEDEAVVAAVLQGESGHGVELVDVHGALPNLRASRGVHSWSVTASADGSGLSRWEDVTEELRVQWRLCPSLFPPPADVAERLGLHRTMRLLPHHNDTGGFFVALLHKTSAAAAPPAHSPAEATAAKATAAEAAAADAPPASTAAEDVLAIVESLDDDEGEDASAGPQGERDRPLNATPDNPDGWLRFSAVGEGSELAAELRSFYGLGDSFSMVQLLSAYSHTTSRRLYLTSAACAEALRTTPTLRVLACGVKVFEKDPSLGVGCSFRIVQEGALHLLPHLHRRVLRVSAPAMLALLEAKTLALPVDASRFSGAPPATDEPSPPLAPPLLALRDRLAAMYPNGSCIVVCDGTSDDGRVGADGSGASAGPAGEGGAGGPSEASVPRTAPQCAVVLMKYTDKASLFVSEGERASLISDLLSYHGDPPFEAQLRPLPTAELARRAQQLAGRGGSWRGAEGAGGADGVDAADGGEGAKGGAAVRREAALEAVARGLALAPRAERRLEGTPLPTVLRNALLTSLRALAWPKLSARPGVDAERYLVFSTRRSTADLGTRHPHHALRSACDELLRWYRSACNDPGYRHTAIAVTKNFRGSPHIDTFDRCPQLAVAVGDFEGGHLCVEGEGGGAHVDVFDTHDRLAKVDGRRVHWVRAFRGAERFSVIFYNTAEDEGEQQQQQHGSEVEAVAGSVS